MLWMKVQSMAMIGGLVSMLCSRGLSLVRMVTSPGLRSGKLGSSSVSSHLQHSGEGMKLE